MTFPPTTVYEPSTRYGPRYTGLAAPRLTLRDQDSPAGPVDGAWWPRTSDPAAELHELVTAVAARLGQMVRVGFDWRTANPDRYCSRGTAPAEATGRAGIMYLFGSNGARLDVLVIPAHTRPGLATAQMRWASGKQWQAPPNRKNAR